MDEKLKVKKKGKKTPNKNHVKLCNKTNKYPRSIVLNITLVSKTLEETNLGLVQPSP